jgi:hypothetical protein
MAVATDPCATVADKPQAIVLDGIHKSALDKWRLDLREIWLEIIIAILVILIDIVAIFVPEISPEGKVTTIGASVTAVIGILRTISTKSQRSQEARVRINNRYRVLCTRIVALHSGPANPAEEKAIAEAIQTWCKDIFEEDEQTYCP